jgi:CheY-like chemotaxis protein
MPSPTSPLILLSDPDRDTRIVYGTILRHLGARVLEVETAQQALDVARTQPISAAVTELLYLALEMSLVRAMRDDERTAMVRVFVVTSDTRPHRHKDAVEAGVAAIRLKPFAPRELAKLVLDL